MKHRAVFLSHSTHCRLYWK